MVLESWFAFVIASAVLLVIPGPTILAVISYSMAHGRQANIPLVIAVALGDSTALFASIIGLGALFAISAFWFTVVKVAGGMYLLYLGIKLFRSGFLVAETVAPDFASSRLKLFANTYLVTALNPKGIVFFVAFLPQFITPGANSTSQLWLLAVTFVTLATINATLYTVFASSARRLLSSAKAQQRFNFAGGALLSTAGVWALFAKRPTI
ncbi:LysE family translocator [Marinobacter sp. 2_MG-2023]|uniref:LysE family translocator n=1 Tax=Marinobacter sp. 2_MG-2023 TaxID=3062679 RepID=UPI0026E416A5|nr:LysE family translocator [Marinobacter sp. 2_MG-2023]MDO6442053.1 LysE family translocator [Marinobacter sp. 2_MG-2023]